MSINQIASILSRLGLSADHVLLSLPDGSQLNATDPRVTFERGCFNVDGHRYRASSASTFAYMPSVVGSAVIIELDEADALTN
jgi:hypothetical protein